MLHRQLDDGVVVGRRRIIFHNVGPVTARKLESLGIRTGADLQERSLAELETGRRVPAVPCGSGAVGLRSGTNTIDEFCAFEILDGKTIPVYDRPEQQAWRLWAIGLAEAATESLQRGVPVPVEEVRSL